MPDSTVRLSRRPLRDIRSIRSFIGRENPVAAGRVAVQLLAACDRLDYLPERGRPGLLPGTREVTSVWPYVIVYRITEAGVEVVHIYHGAQHR